MKAKISKVVVTSHIAHSDNSVRHSYEVHYESGVIREFFDCNVSKNVVSFLDKATLIDSSFIPDFCYDSLIESYRITENETGIEENVAEQPENLKVYNSYEEYEKTHENCQPKMNEVSVVYDGEYVCIDAIFDCKRVSTAVRRLFKNVDVKLIPEFDGWYECISEATENGFFSDKDTSVDSNEWYGGYAWCVECDEHYIYISLKVRRETDTEEQPENVSEPDAEEFTPKGEKIMTYHEMTKKYEERGLTDYQLHTLDDLKEIHGLDVRSSQDIQDCPRTTRTCLTLPFCFSTMHTA